MPALKWLRLLMNHIPDKYEHLVRYYGDYSKGMLGAIYAHRFSLDNWIRLLERNMLRRRDD